MGWKSKLKKTVSSVTKPVTKTVSSVTKPVTETVSSVTKPVTETVSSVTKPVTETVASAVQKTVAGAVGAVTDSVGAVKDIGGVVSNVANTMTHGLSAAINAAIPRKKASSQSAGSAGEITAAPVIADVQADNKNTDLLAEQERARLLAAGRSATMSAGETFGLARGWRTMKKLGA